MKFSIFMTVQTSYVSHFHQSPPLQLEPNSNSVRIPFAKKKFHSNYFFPELLLSENGSPRYVSPITMILTHSRLGSVVLYPLLFTSSFYAITSSYNVINWEALGPCKLLKKYTIIMNIVSTSVMKKLTSEQRQNPFLANGDDYQSYKKVGGSTTDLQPSSDIIRYRNMYRYTAKKIKRSWLLIP